MTATVIPFDRNRKAATARPEAKAARPAQAGEQIVSLAEWKARSHARRTAHGVFFSTGVLCTIGTAA